MINKLFKYDTNNMIDKTSNNNKESKIYNLEYI